MSEPMRIHGEWHIPYQYTIGDLATTFFQRLRGGRIVGSRCPQCSRVSVPPKSFCEMCFVPSDEVVEVGNEGTIEAVTVVTAPFAGSPRVPYAVAYVRLDGATSAICNYVQGVDLSDLKALPDALSIESRVGVVFSDQPEGRVTDFWFEPTNASA